MACDLWAFMKRFSPSLWWNDAECFAPSRCPQQIAQPQTQRHPMHRRVRLDEMVGMWSKHWSLTFFGMSMYCIYCILNCFYRNIYIYSVCVVLFIWSYSYVQCTSTLLGCFLFKTFPCPLHHWLGDYESPLNPPHLGILKNTTHAEKPTKTHVFCLFLAQLEIEQGCENTCWAAGNAAKNWNQDISLKQVILLNFWSQSPRNMMKQVYGKSLHWLLPYLAC